MSAAGQATTQHAWVVRGPGDLAWQERSIPALRPDGILVRIETARVLGKVIDGKLGYALPPFPFVPGANAVGRVLAAGDEVSHLAAGRRVFLSPHLSAPVPAGDGPQILIGLTAMGSSRFRSVPDAARRLQEFGATACPARWRTGPRYARHRSTGWTIIRPRG